MKHLILGTAGHIDHGKTALVKALTGIDCDTHEEEKRRGITINLGFAHLTLPGGQTMGVVDVPGHRDFIQTMVSGSSGIDIALLVVAANEGIMPQTREHMQIMEILGITSGVLVVTKIDLVDNDALARVHRDIREFTKNTFLKAAPLCDVSAVSGSGIAALKETIAALTKTVGERSAGEAFRMYIDRIFSVSGFGTVVTGSVKSGRLAVDQSVYLLPPGKQLRVRRIERFGSQVAEALAGDRASCNLVGLSKEDFKRGMLIADRPLRTSVLLDAKVTLFFDVKQLAIWTHVILLKDTFETLARIHLLDRNRLKAGEAGLVQIHTTDPCVARAGDRFVIRSTSSDSTLGGGEIIDAMPLHHRRRTAALLDGLHNMAEGEFSRRIAVEVQKHVHGANIIDIADSLNCGPEEIVKAVSSASDDGIVLFGSGNGRTLISAANALGLSGKILRHLEDYHQKHPLEQTGRTREEMSGALAIERQAANDFFLSAFLENLVRIGSLKKVGHSYALASHSVVLSDELRRSAADIEALVRDYGMQTPLSAELEKKAGQKGMNAAQLQSVLKYLTETKTLYAIDGVFIHSGTVNECRMKLLAELLGRQEGITVAGFRDLVRGNRKICLLLLAIFDREAVIERRGDVRVITEKGRELARLSR
jgi:selenocysteine-specific elongation factor